MMTRYRRAVWFLTLAGVGLLAATAHGADERVPLLPPVKGEETPVCDPEEPTDAEVIRAMQPTDRKAAEKARGSMGFQITRELLTSKLGPARFYPVAGFARLHTCIWKCTVHFTEKQNPAQRVVVVYIDKDHLHRHDLPAAVPAQPTPAAELPIVPPEFALVPEDATVLLTVKAGRLIELFHLRDKCHLIPILDELTVAGLPVAEIDRLTVATNVKMKGRAQWVEIATFDKPLDRAAILKPYFAKARTVTIHGKDCHLHQDNQLAICFVDDRTIVVASQDALKECLKPRKPLQERKDAAAKELKSVGSYDFHVWTDAEVIGLAFGVGLPKTVESAAVSLDFGPRIDLRVRVGCTDADGVAWTKKMLPSLATHARAHLLTGVMRFDGTDTLNLASANADLAKLQELHAMPVKLMRLTEKGLQSARVSHLGTNVFLDVAIPLDEKALRGELNGAVWLLEPGLPRGITPFGHTEKGATIGGAMGAVIGSATGNPKTGAVVGGLVGSGLGAIVGAEVDSKAKPAQPMPPAGVQQAAHELREQGTAPKLEGIPGLIKITVANVRKVPVRVYECLGDGKLKLVGKVDAGAATDLKLTSQTRHVAVIAETPDADPVLEAFTPVTADAVWLIRP